MREALLGVSLRDHYARDSLVRGVVAGSGVVPAELATQSPTRTTLPVHPKSGWPGLTVTVDGLTLVFYSKRGATLFDFLLLSDQFCIEFPNSTLEVLFRYDWRLLRFCVL